MALETEVILKMVLQILYKADDKEDAIRLIEALVPKEALASVKESLGILVEKE